MEFKYDGGGLGKGGAVALYVDGKSVGQGRLEESVPMAFSADETCDIGKESGSPVSPDYGPTGNEFSGEVNWVQIDLDKDDHDTSFRLKSAIASRWHANSLASRGEQTRVFARSLHDSPRRGTPCAANRLQLKFNH
jgi:hypothetical protein